MRRRLPLDYKKDCAEVRRKESIHLWSLHHHKTSSERKAEQGGVSAYELPQRLIKPIEHSRNE